MSERMTAVEEFESPPPSQTADGRDEEYYRALRPEQGRTVRFRHLHDMIDLASIERIEINIDTDPPDASFPDHNPPIKEYGEQWDWDSATQDYIRFTPEGVKLLYTDYQTVGIQPRSPTPSQSAHASIYRHPSPKPQTSSIPRPVQSPVSDRPLYETALGEEFSVITKPKRFFCVGRIFKTVWFEPAGTDPPRRRPDLEQWSNNSLAFHGEKPAARFRWFVVVRRRLHQSLCFSITTFGGKGSSKTIRGRLMDYVVLHSAAVEPPRPYDEEGITRDPIAVIIEDKTQYISPIARLDCGRVYTVEDNLRVMKVGRVHPESIPLLETYYMECVS
ncbi:hypothetical protein VTI74DRAFT_10056 [Chaetomium olivicolor]